MTKPLTQEIADAIEDSENVIVDRESGMWRFYIGITHPDPEFSWNPVTKEMITRAQAWIKEQEKRNEVNKHSLTRDSL